LDFLVLLDLPPEWLLERFLLEPPVFTAGAGAAGAEATGAAGAEATGAAGAEATGAAGAAGGGATIAS